MTIPAAEYGPAARCLAPPGGPDARPPGAFRALADGLAVEARDLASIWDAVDEVDTGLGAEIAGACRRLAGLAAELADAVLPAGSSLPEELLRLAADLAALDDHYAGFMSGERASAADCHSEEGIKACEDMIVRLAPGITLADRAVRALEEESARPVITGGRLDPGVRSAPAPDQVLLAVTARQACEAAAKLRDDLESLPPGTRGQVAPMVWQHLGRASFGVAGFLEKADIFAGPAGELRAAGRALSFASPPPGWARTARAEQAAALAARAADYCEALGGTPLELYLRHVPGPHRDFGPLEEPLARITADLAACATAVPSLGTSRELFAAAARRFRASGTPEDGHASHAPGGEARPAPEPPGPQPGKPTTGQARTGRESSPRRVPR